MWLTLRNEFLGFETYVIRKLKEQTKILKSNSQTLQEIQAKLQPQAKTDQLFVLHATIDGIPTLPLTNMEDFDKFEEAIMDETCFITLVITY